MIQPSLKIYFITSKNRMITKYIHYYYKRCMQIIKSYSRTWKILYINTQAASEYIKTVNLKTPDIAIKYSLSLGEVKGVNLRLVPHTCAKTCLMRMTHNIIHGLGWWHYMCFLIKITITLNKYHLLLTLPCLKYINTGRVSFSWNKKR